MRLRHVVLTASVLGIAGLVSVRIEAGEVFGWLKPSKSCDGDATCYDETGGACGISKLWDYHYWHNKTMPKRKMRQESIHQWQRWFLNPVVTPDTSCNYGYFETQWRRPPFESSMVCPPGEVIQEMESIPAPGMTDIPSFPMNPEPMPSSESQYSPPEENTVPAIPGDLPQMPPVEANPSEARFLPPITVPHQPTLEQIQRSHYEYPHNSNTGRVQLTMETEQQEMPEVSRPGIVCLEDRCPTIVTAREAQPVKIRLDDSGFTTVEDPPKRSAEIQIMKTKLEVPAFPIRTNLPRIENSWNNSIR